MKLNHINLGVSDVAQAVDIFGRFFGLVPAGGGMPVNEHMAFLHDDAGSLISVFRVKEPQYPKVFHIGFLQDTPEQVRAIYAELTGAGFDIAPPAENHGRLTFYFNSPFGVQIEVESFFEREGEQ
ncbi:VOC family protein [Deinococcus lacus]|uniref:VOC family protein n=1 Tax=Deinococcus lacus TaxID=392561 RepID=A0ABW1YDZ0_9DEIO